MVLPTRPALPTRSVPDLDGPVDTAALSTENHKRIKTYIAKSRELGYALPADGNRTTRLGIEQAAREAGVRTSAMRAGRAPRAELDKYRSEAGLAIIVYDDNTSEHLRLPRAKERLLAAVATHAAATGVRPRTLEGNLSEILDLVAQRISLEPEKSIAGILDDLVVDGREGHLSLSRRALGILPKLPEWLDRPDRPPSELSDLEFPALLRIAIIKTKMSQAEVADISGLRLPNLQRWLRGERSPNARSFGGLRKIAQMAEWPEDTLIKAIRRIKSDSPHKIRKIDLPERFRGPEYAQLRHSVRLRLREDHLALPLKLYREVLAALCEKVLKERKVNINRKAMRNRNRIDRSLFSKLLTSKIEDYAQYLENRGLANNTISSYIKCIEGYFSFSLSENAPVDLRLQREKACLIHAGSPKLWDSFLAHREDVGRVTMEKPDFRVDRASVERMKFVESLFQSSDGYFAKSAQSVGNLETLGREHLYYVGSPDRHRDILYETRREIGNIRKQWMRRSRRPVRGRDEIDDLLSMPDPMIAVRAMIEYQRAVVNNLMEKGVGRTKLAREDGRRETSLYYATAVRKLITIHLLAQTALRVGMLPCLIMGYDEDAHFRIFSDRMPRLKIPASMFKNGKGQFFRNEVYERDLEDWFGFREDLELYLAVAHPRLVDDSDCNLLFPAWKEDAVVPMNPKNISMEIVKISRAAIGSDAPPEHRLIRRSSLTAHHFRDILATSVLKRTNRDYALAADAIHVSEQTCRQYYAYDSPELRQPELKAILADLGRSSS